MKARHVDDRALPQSKNGKPHDLPNETVARAFQELFELLEEYAPVWYTEQHRKRALAASRVCKSLKRADGHAAETDSAMPGNGVGTFFSSQNTRLP